MPEPHKRLRRRPAAGWIALGLYLAVASLYVLSSPGRIDIVDGQIRFEVADSLVREGRPVLRDPFIRRFGTLGPDGEVYSRYGAGASVAGLPLVWLGSLSPDLHGETRRFLFSMTSPLAGAAIAPLLFAFYLALGMTRRSAVGWTLVTAFASLVWQVSTTTFDQAQHAVLLLAALLLGYLSGRRDSFTLAAAGGLVAGLLVNYQETYVLLFPLLAAATLGGAGSAGRRRGRWLLFLAATAVGLALWAGYNWICFENPFLPGKLRPGLSGHPTVRGNVLLGLAGLILSPGKSVFLYSPTVLLGILGLRGLWRRERELAAAVALTSLVHLVFTAGMSFWHGDWAWGPRYLVVLLPLLALAAPWVDLKRARRAILAVLVAAGVSSQLLGLALVHERFFHERGLGAFFWADDNAFYFRDSALLSRPFEIRRALAEAEKATARDFSHGPYRDLTTYFIAGFPDPRQGPEAILRFRVFHLPRPWPLWMPRLDPGRYPPPVSPGRWTAALALVFVLGSALVAAGSRARGLTGGESAASS